MILARDASVRTNLPAISIMFVPLSVNSFPYIAFLVFYVLDFPPSQLCVTFSFLTFPPISFVSHYPVLHFRVLYLASPRRCAQSIQIHVLFEYSNTRWNQFRIHPAQRTTTVLWRTVLHTVAVSTNESGDRSVDNVTFAAVKMASGSKGDLARAKTMEITSKVCTVLFCIVYRLIANMSIRSSLVRPC